ncbi:MAG: hypothetical protein AAGI37_19535 [Planctomycetota bacterium]
MAQALRIIQYNDRHEDQSSRRVGTLTYVQAPVDQTGEGLMELKAMENGLETFGVYMCLVELAATLPIRGVLAKPRQPLSINRLAVLTQIPAAIMRRSVKILTSAEIGWLDHIDFPIDGRLVQVNKSVNGKARSRVILPHLIDQNGELIDRSPRTHDHGGELVVTVAVNTPKPKANKTNGEADSYELTPPPIKSKKPRKRDPLFDAVAECEGIKTGTRIPASTAKRIGAVVAELRAKDADAVDVPERWAWVQQTFDNATIQALAKHWTTSGTRTATTQIRSASMADAESNVSDPREVQI